MAQYQPTGLKKILHTSRRFLAKQWLSFNHPFQIAITGSQGKTATGQLIAQLLSSIGKTVVTDINLDTNYNLPVTALKITPWTKYAVFELGIDQPGEMNLHLEIVKPTIAVITGISPVHTDKEHLGSLVNLIKEKRRLIEVLPKNGSAILNYDDKNVRAMAPYTKAKVLFYGTDRRACHVWADNIKVSLQGTKFNLNPFQPFDSTQGKPVSTKLIGVHHIYTFMAAYLVLKIIQPKNISFIDHFLKIAAASTPLRGRMNVEPGPLKTVLLNDSLRANPESVRAGLETLYKISFPQGRKIAILGVMGELQHPKIEHEKTGRQIVHFPPDLVVCIGNLRKYTQERAVKNGYPKKRIFWVKNVFAAAQLLRRLIKKNDLLYLKGSLLRNLKRVIQLLNNEPVCCRLEICPYKHCGYSEV